MKDLRAIGRDRAIFNCNRPRPTGSALDIVTIAVMVFVFIEIPTPNTKRRETAERRTSISVTLFSTTQTMQRGCRVLKPPVTVHTPVRVELFSYSMTFEGSIESLVVLDFRLSNGLRREWSKSHCRWATASARTSRDTRFTKPRTTY